VFLPKVSERLSWQIYAAKNIIYRTILDTIYHNNINYKHGDPFVLQFHR